jgi:hypothetical protein
VECAIGSLRRFPLVEVLVQELHAHHATMRPNKELLLTGQSAGVPSHSPGGSRSGSA